LQSNARRHDVLLSLPRRNVVDIEGLRRNRVIVYEDTVGEQFEDRAMSWAKEQGIRETVLCDADHDL
jgi:hypothetical protein